jgi:hypothetical protein
MHWAKAMSFALFVSSAPALSVAMLEYRAINIAACANAAVNLNEFLNTDEV